MLLFRCVFFFFFAHSWVRIQFELETWGWMKKKQERTTVSISFLCDPKLFEYFSLHSDFKMIQQFSEKMFEMQRKSMPCSSRSIASLHSHFARYSFRFFYFSKEYFFFVGFHSFVYFSAKPITCLYIFGWMRVLCWSIGWLVGLLVGRRVVCLLSLALALWLTHSFVRSLYHPRPHSLTRARARTLRLYIYNLFSRARMCLSMCKYLSRFASHASDSSNTISIRTHARTQAHIHTHWLPRRTLAHINVCCMRVCMYVCAYGGLDYPCHWYQLVIPKSQIRQRFQAPILSH